MLNRIVLAFSTLTIMLLNAPLPAAEFCATNSQEFQAALSSAAINGEDNVIRITTGTYPVPNGGFVFDANVTDGTDGNLTIVGGFTEFFGNPCGQILSENPWLTVLDGGGHSRVMRILPRNGSSGNVNVRLLTFMNGKTNNAGAGLYVGGLNHILGGQITVERNVFLLNETQLRAAALEIWYHASDSSSRLRMVNNVILANRSNDTFSGSVLLRVDGGNDGIFGAGIFAINNSVINNTADGYSSGPMEIEGSVPNKYVINNNLWGNGARDLFVNNFSGIYRFWNNNIGVRAGSDPDNESGNISVEPEYEPCGILCFHLIPSINSQLVDTGRHPPSPPLIATWLLPQFDARGEPRVDAVGARVDIGAYESHDRFFADRFEQ